MAGTQTSEFPFARAEWEPATRMLFVSFEPGAAVGRAEAEQLIEQFRVWIGEQPEPYKLLVDLSNMVDSDAGWRAEFADFFTGHRDRLTLAHFGASAWVRLLAMMFMRGTRINGRGFETEVEARTWLHAADAAA